MEQHAQDDVSIIRTTTLFGDRERNALLTFSSSSLSGWISSARTTEFYTAVDENLSTCRTKESPATTREPRALVEAALIACARKVNL